MKDSTGYGIVSIILVLGGWLSLRIAITTSSTAAFAVGGGLLFLALYIAYLGYEEYKKEQSSESDKITNSNVMFCIKCGKPQDHEGEYCPYCGNMR